jgi:8-oxo-dGTP diphosphatase
VSTTAKAKFSVGVSVLVTRGTKLLLGKRQNTSTADGLLSTPGGRLEENERLVDCGIREAHEEVGLIIERNAMEFIGFKEHMRYGKHYFMFYFWARSFAGEIINREPDKCEGWDWHEITEIQIEQCTEPPDVLIAVLSRAEKQV